MSSGSGDHCIAYSIPWKSTGTDSGTVSNSYAEIGLYYTGTTGTNGNNLKIVGATAASGTPSPSGSQLVTNQPITILTTMSTTNPVTGPDIQNVTFVDTGNAYAGLNIGNTNGFNISNNGFSGFTGGGTIVAHDIQGGAAIVAAAGQATPRSVSRPNSISVQ